MTDGLETALAAAERVAACANAPVDGCIACASTKSPTCDGWACITCAEIHAATDCELCRGDAAAAGWWATNGSKFSSPDGPAIADVWNIDAVPTYTRDVDGEPRTFDQWVHGEPWKHYAAVGSYARVEHPTDVTRLADGSTVPVVTYRATGGPVGWVDALPTWADVERSHVRRGRNKRGNTAVVIRNGRTRRGGLTEQTLVERTRAFVLAACEDCMAAVAACESFDSHGDRAYCRQCVDGCGCLPDLIGIECKSWSEVVAGGLATDTRLASINRREATADRTLAAAAARWARHVRTATAAGREPSAARRDAFAAAETRHTATVARCAEKRTELWRESFGLAAVSPCAIARADAIDGFVPFLATLPRSDAADVRDRFAATATGRTVRRTTRFASRHGLRTPRWRKGETDATAAAVTAIVDDGRTWQGWLRHGEVIRPVTVAINLSGRRTALLSPDVDPAYAWLGHRRFLRPTSNRAHRTVTAAATATIAAINAECPLAVGDTMEHTTADGTVRIKRASEHLFRVHVENGWRNVRTWATAARLAKL